MVFIYVMMNCELTLDSKLIIPIKTYYLEIGIDSDEIGSDIEVLKKRKITFSDTTCDYINYVSFCKIYQ